MDKDNIKEYIVCVNGGSGVIFQPMDDDWTYILTAKHIFENEEGELTTENAKIHYYNHQESKFEPINELKLIIGVNYFPHSDPKTDISILKIGRISSSIDLIVADNGNKNTTIYLCGFPSVRRRENIVNNNTCRFDSISEILQGKEDNQKEAKLRTITTYGELKGQSGGGVFSITDQSINLLGIQNEIPEINEDEQLGFINYTPVSVFKEIADEYNDKLEPIIPCHLKCFSFLKNDTFNFTGGRRTAEFVERVTTRLRSLYQGLIDSSITPQFLIEEYGSELLLLNGQNIEHLSARKLWVCWMELLILRNFIHEKNSTTEDVSEMKNEMRFFYSDTDYDFFYKHLEDLTKSNYNGLRKGGRVYVASNTKAKENFCLDTSLIPEDISKLKDNYEWDIGDASDFPLENYKFIDVSIFKEETLVKKYSQFENKSPQEQLTQLRTLYNDIINA